MRELTAEIRDQKVHVRGFGSSTNSLRQISQWLFSQEADSPRSGLDCPTVRAKTSSRTAWRDESGFFVPAGQSKCVLYCAGGVIGCFSSGTRIHKTWLNLMSKWNGNRLTEM